MYKIESFCSNLNWDKKLKSLDNYKISREEYNNVRAYVNSFSFCINILHLTGYGAQLGSFFWEHDLRSKILSTHLKKDPNPKYDGWI